MKQNFDAEQFKDIYPCTAEQWFNRNKLYLNNYEAMKTILELNKINSGQVKVLDWGCGNLMWGIGLFPQAEITGVEISKEALGFAEVNARKNGVKFNPVYIDSVDLLKNESFDIAIAISLIEFFDEKQFENIFTCIFNKLKFEGKLICTFHNWRRFSALYISYLFKKDAYDKFCVRHGYKISKKTLTQVEEDFCKIGFKVLETGAFNPYPIRFSKTSKCKLFYKTRSKVFAHWYCTQYIVLSK